MERRWQRMHPNESGQATRAAHAVSLLWGFAEATVFFVVPDVWISRRALSSWRAALRGCGFALAGALVGGGLLSFAGRHHAAALLALFERLPEIGRTAEARVGKVVVRTCGYRESPYPTKKIT